MANCMTCRHNDKKAQYCPIKQVHTGLGYVLNCVDWEETDERKMKRLRDDNAKLRELVRDMLPFAEVGMDDTCVIRRCCLFEQCEDTTVVKCAIEQHMLDRMRELGIEVPDV